MANLLPEQYSALVKRERRIRTVVVTLVFLWVVEVVLSLSLIPSLVLSKARKESIGEQLKSLQGFIAEREQSDVAEEARIVRGQLDALAIHHTTLSTKSIIDSVLRATISGIELGGLEYERNGTTLSLQGVSSNRDILRAFADKLEAEPLFQSVNLPISDLAVRSNIPFRLSMEIVLPTTP